MGQYLFKSSFLTVRVSVEYKVEKTTENMSVVCIYKRIDVSAVDEHIKFAYGSAMLSRPMRIA